MTNKDARPRYVLPGACTWCAHRPHDGVCPSTIRTSTDGTTGPCPCGVRSR